MLGNLKVMLGIPEYDTTLDKKLLLILSATRSRLKALLGGLEPPEELDYIILEVSVIRYNKIGSEGAISHDVEGEKTSYSNNDFAGFMEDIQTYLDNQKNSRKGKVVFL